MKQPLLFLSHAGEDAAAARELARHLERSDVPVWLDVERLRPGDPWLESLERALRQATAFAVYVGRSGVERWVGQEVRVALDRSVNEPGFTVVPVLGPGSDPEALPVFLRQYQWVDLRGGLDAAGPLRELAEVVLGEDRRGERLRRSLLPPGRAPFLGLRTFAEEDAFLFFGRDREVEELLARLGSEAFLAVVGASGSGKSSLVRAGLLPALRRGRAPGGREGAGSGAASGSPVASWRIALFRPADDPFRELAAALPGLDPELGAAERIEVGARIARELAAPGSGAAGIERAVAALVPAGTRTLLVADQLEEAFTQTAGPEPRRGFLDALLAAGRLGGDRPVHVVATLRADFYSRCWEHPELPSRIAANQFAVERMAADQLREVIEKPLALAGVEPEPGLVDELLDDAGDEPGNLPLLEHALFQLWDQPAGRRFTHEAYRAMGGLAGALEHHAEAVYEGLDAEQRDLLRRLLPRLAVVGDPGAVTRRRVPKEDLLAASGPVEDGRARAAALLDLWVERRLLTAMGAGAEAGEERVEAAHEALLRSWDRLRGWLEEDREFLLWRQGLAEAVDAWEDTNRGEGELLRGGPLRRAADWLERRRSDLTPSEAALIEASLAHETAERERELAQARARAAAERRARLRLAWAALALFAGILATGWLMFQARRQERLAFARELAARAETVVEARPQLGTLLALHALRIAEEEAGEPGLPEGETALRAGLARLGGRVVGDPAEEVLSGSVTDRAVLLATTVRNEEGGSLRLRRVPLPLPPEWEIATGEALEVMAEWPSTAALSPSGRWLVASPEGHPPRLWRLASGGAEATRVELLDEAGEDPSAAAAWLEIATSPEAERLRVGGTDELARTWILPSERPSAALAVATVTPTWDFTPTFDCRGEAGLDGSGASDSPRDLVGHDRPISGCASHLGAGGAALLTWNMDEPARLWQAGSQAWTARVDPVPAGDLGRSSREISFDSTGRWLIESRNDLALVAHPVRRADHGLALGPESEPLECGLELRTHRAAVSPGGSHLAFQSWDYTLCVIEAGSDGGLGRAGPMIQPPDEFWVSGAVWDLAVSAGGRVLAASTEELIAQVFLIQGLEECPGGPAARALNPHFTDLVRLAFGTEGWLAAGDGGGLLQLYRIAPAGGCSAPEEILTYLDDESAILSLGFGKRRLAVGHGSGVIELWDLDELPRDSARPQQLLDHRSGVSMVALADDDSVLVSADADGNLLLWDLGRRAPARPVRLARMEPVVAAALRHDGPHLVAVDRSGRVLSFSLELSRLQDLACRAVGRNLSAAEVAVHLGEEGVPLVCPSLPPGR